MNTLEAYALDDPDTSQREPLVRALRREHVPIMILDTCQRLELFASSGWDSSLWKIRNSWQHVAAFERLARVAAGLESRILGEFEILGQVRTAYKEFHTRTAMKHTHLDRIFQDSVALARKARRESGIDRRMISLNGLAGREILRRVEAGSPIAVVGSGSLAESIIRHLGKRGTSPIRVSSRCPENAVRLALSVGGFGAGLDDLQHLLAGVAGIISATAAPHPVVYPHHIQRSSKPLHIIDLGVPPDCSPAIREIANIKYFGLDEIEFQAMLNLEEQNRRARVAAEIIRRGALQWSGNS